MVHSFKISRLHCRFYDDIQHHLLPAATALPRSERSAESIPTSTLQTTINSTLCGDVRMLLQQQGRDGRDGRDGLQGKQGPRGPAGPSGMKGEKGKPGIQLQGSPGPQGRYIAPSQSLFSHTVHAILYNTHRRHESSQYSRVSVACCFTKLHL